MYLSVSTTLLKHPPHEASENSAPLWVEMLTDGHNFTSENRVDSALAFPACARSPVCIFYAVSLNGNGPLGFHLAGAEWKYYKKWGLKIPGWQQVVESGRVSHLRWFDAKRTVGFSNFYCFVGKTWWRRGEGGKAVWSWGRLTGNFTGSDVERISVFGGNVIGFSLIVSGFVVMKRFAWWSVFFDWKTFIVVRCFNKITFHTNWEKLIAPYGNTP